MFHFNYVDFWLVSLASSKFSEQNWLWLAHSFKSALDAMIWCGFCNGYHRNLFALLTNLKHELYKKCSDIFYIVIASIDRLVRLLLRGSSFHSLRSFKRANQNKWKMWTLPRTIVAIFQHIHFIYCDVWERSLRPYPAPAPFISFFCLI